MTLALLQQEASNDTEDNLQRTVAATKQAAKEGAQVVCTQELFTTEYFCQSEDHNNFKLAEPIPGPTTKVFQEIAREEDIVVIASIFEQRAAGLYHNSAAVIDAGGELLGIYRKMHIPDDPLYYEKFYFTPGDKDPGFCTWHTKYGRIGVLICWDQWYPEAARITALAGAEILLYPTAIGWHPAEKATEGNTQHAAWQAIQRSHAIGNGCFVAAANRIGHEKPSDDDGLEFWGQSFVAAPSGEVIANASADKEEILLAELNMEEVNVARTHWPFLRDRRIDAYEKITRRFLD